jgi:hypothetical protein
MIVRVAPRGPELTAGGHALPGVALEEVTTADRTSKTWDVVVSAPVDDADAVESGSRRFDGLTLTTHLPTRSALPVVVLAVTLKAEELEPTERGEAAVTAA